MDKKLYFKKLVKVHRKLLIKKRFPASTLSMYVNGNMFPREEVARRIAKITGGDLDKIPYWRLN